MNKIINIFIQLCIAGTSNIKEMAASILEKEINDVKSPFLKRCTAVLETIKVSAARHYSDDLSEDVKAPLYIKDQDLDLTCKTIDAVWMTGTCRIMGGNIKLLIVIRDILQRASDRVYFCVVWNICQQFVVNIKWNYRHLLHHYFRDVIHVVLSSMLWTVG